MTRRESRQKLREVPEQSSSELRGIAAHRRGDERTIARREGRKELHELGIAASREHGEHCRIEPAQEWEKSVSEHGIRHAGLYWIGAPHGDGEASLRRLFDQRAGETGLPDAALAGENDRPAATLIRALQRGRKRRQLRLTTG